MPASPRGSSAHRPARPQALPGTRRRSRGTSRRPPPASRTATAELLLPSGVVLCLLDAATGKERATPRGHARPVSGLAFGPDGKVLASGAGNYQAPQDVGEI